MSEITGVCPRCKEQIDWKRRYGKYKSLTEPAKWFLFIYLYLISNCFKFWIGFFLNDYFNLFSNVKQSTLFETCSSSSLPQPLYRLVLVILFRKLQFCFPFGSCIHFFFWDCSVCSCFSKVCVRDMLGCAKEQKVCAKCCSRVNRIVGRLSFNNTMTLLFCEVAISFIGSFW